jgi:fructose-1,6-bisphosphatase/inositol monophosphatase family enzyme
VSVDIEWLAGVLRAAAKAEILPRFRRLDESDVQVKTEAIDLVTAADLAAEQFIKAEISRQVPGALFVGEESVAADPQLLSALAGADLAVVVDPIDGTANYAAGLPLFAVMAAVVAGGETIGGIIYDPMGDDWMMAEKGSGTWLCRPDGSSNRLHVAAPLPMPEMVGTASIAFVPPGKKVEILQNFAKVRLVSHYRVAGHEYRTFVSGHSQFLSYNKLMPWDHLGGALMAQEAGGYVARMDGSPYRPYHTEGGLLAATNEESWRLLRENVFTF